MRKVVGGVAIVLALAALVAAYGCGRAVDAAALASRDAAGTWLRTTPAGGTPVVVSCAPGQRVVVRAADTARGAPAEVECLTAPGAYGWGVSEAAWGAPRVTPAVYQPAPVPERQVVYREAPPRAVRRGRTWQKSALIIGSSAGVGAGIGAAVGGKKGALIGAAIGGGGATIWDQTTRR